MLGTKIDFHYINTINSEEELFKLIKKLRVMASNKNEPLIYQYIENAIKQSSKLKDAKSLIRLYDLQIRQLYNHTSNIEEIKKILTKMCKLSQEIEFSEGLALIHQIKWHLGRLQGNIKESKKEIQLSLEVIKERDVSDAYTLFTCKYSYAIEIWLKNHNTESAVLLEDCVEHFIQEGFYRSLAQTFGLLSMIYTRTHDSKKALNMSNAILANRLLFENLPRDVKGITYYFTGLGHMLDANLAIAESYFNEAYTILKPIYKNSIYFAYYLVLLSYLATVKGLQGKTEQAAEMVKEASKTLQTAFVKKNLDKNSKKQITHTHNLTNFYNLSRLSKYDPQEHQELINEIVKGSENLYSDFMTFSEFILNSDLDSDTLQEVLAIENFSINRVKHLIEFMLEKQKLDTEINQEQRVLNCIAILEKRVKTSKTTFMENAYADLLIAQELFSLKRYAEISPLLRKYESRLKQIEVLEMRIFMEAFIQVGAFKNGDPLGPALQYMAIKKCRLYGFSRLENKLLDYLQLQHKEIRRAVQ